jgi:hypothetical protein
MLFYALENQAALPPGPTDDHASLWLKLYRVLACLRRAR